MKRKIFGVVLMAILAVAAGWNFNQSKNEIALSELGIANMEALANPENTNKKGLPTSKEVTKYFYDENGRLIRTEKYTASCCASGSLDCSNPPCSDESL